MSDQGEHAALFKRAGDMLALQAGMLTKLKGPVQLSWQDVADLFAATAANIYLHEIGPGAAVAHLRQLADGIECGQSAVN